MGESADADLPGRPESGTLPVCATCAWPNSLRLPSGARSRPWLPLPPSLLQVSGGTTPSACCKRKRVCISRLAAAVAGDGFTGAHHLAAAASRRLATVAPIARPGLASHRRFGAGPLSSKLLRQPTATSAPATTPTRHQAVAIATRASRPTASRPPRPSPNPEPQPMLPQVSATTPCASRPTHRHLQLPASRPTPMRERPATVAAWPAIQARGSARAGPSTPRRQQCRANQSRERDIRPTSAISAAPVAAAISSAFTGSALT